MCFSYQIINVSFIKELMITYVFNIKVQKNDIYSQTCVQRPPLGPEKSGRLKEVPD